MLEFKVSGKLFKVVTEILITGKWAKDLCKSTATKYTKWHLDFQSLLQDWNYKNKQVILQFLSVESKIPI